MCVSKRALLRRWWEFEPRWWRIPRYVTLDRWFMERFIETHLNPDPLKFSIDCRCDRLKMLDAERIATLVIDLARLIHPETVDELRSPSVCLPRLPFVFEAPIPIGVPSAPRAPTCPQDAAGRGVEPAIFEEPFERIRVREKSTTFITHLNAPRMQHSSSPSNMRHRWHSIVSARFVQGRRKHSVGNHPVLGY